MHYLYKSKLGSSLGIYRFNWSKLLYPEKDFNINDDESLISKSVEKLKNDLDFDYNFKNQSNQDNILGEKIDKIIEIIFDSSYKLFMDNKVLFNHKLFQHFGIDFILTKNGPKLLEINKDPNLTSHYLGNRDKEILMKELMLSQMYDIVRNDSLGIQNKKKKIFDYLLIKKIENPKLLLNK